MNILRRIFGGSAKKPDAPDEFGVRKLSNRDLAHQLALGKNILKHHTATKAVIDMHPDPERQKHWRERYAENSKQVGAKVTALEDELNRRASGND